MDAGLERSGRILPNFFIAGAPKSGTTSLYHYLDQHPQIYMSPVKEPNYFASEIRPQQFSARLRPRAEQDAPLLRAYLDGPMRGKRFGGLVTEWSDYLRLFQRAGGRKAIGEASVSYLWSRTAAANIRRKIPHARIILILRQPAEMVFSMYLHSAKSVTPACSFREAIELGLKQRGGKLDEWHPFLDMGLYSEQVKHFFEKFPAEQVSLHLYEEYSAEPMRVMRELFRFLEVDPNFRPDMSQRYLERPRGSVSMDPADRAYLAEFYREDIGKLAELLQRDLSGWLREPGL